MSKTAISILQEYLQKKSYSLPTYTLVDQLGPQHQTTFTIRASFDSYSADGTAKTKQAAKHNAASAMIKLLNEQPGHHIDYDQPSINVLPSPSILQQKNRILHYPELSRLEDDQPVYFSCNSIGMLQEICAQRKMKSPIYEECHSGPQGGFTFQCKLGAIVQEATASSKKQAKQKSAELMRQYLIEKNLASDNIMVASQDQKDDQNVLVFETGKLILDERIKVSTEKAKQLFPSMKKNVGITVEERNDLSIANFHNQFRNSIDPADVKKFLSYYKSLNFDELRSSVGNSESILRNMENILHIKTQRKDMKTDGFDKFLVSIEFLSKPAPVFREIGRGNSYNEAYLAALVRTITAVHLLLI